MIPSSLRWVLLRGWPLLLPLCLASSALWAESADEWLLRMGQAFREQNYDGTFIYVRGDELQSFRIIHRADAGIEQERLIHLDGAAHELLRTGEGLFAIQADAPISETAAKASFAQSFAREPGQLAQHYRLELLGDERVSNRQCRRIAIRPHDPDRYSHELWIDQASGLLLRSLLRDTDGRTLERFQFVTLRVADDVSVGDLTSMTHGSTTLHRVHP
ncbi:MAG TPA: sigma-E factor regulatory protein RseB domain-containing protein, partial [Pseudomonadales bacterium]|nr:sigma-E factor regulatory protein RseB domain-containing protein [Pseudomonadales bacterium]